MEFLQKSIQTLQSVIQPKDDKFLVTPTLAFIGDGLVPLTEVRLNKIFDENTILDVIIFGNGNNVFCASFGEADTVKLFTKVKFQEMILAEFSQDISPKTEPFDQLLAIKDGKLEFVSIHSENTFIALNSLSSFISMLQQADILKPTEIRKKRSFFDIFSAYSVDSIVQTAHSNYEKLNGNFAQIERASTIMQNNQKLAAQQMANINNKDQLIYKKALYLEYNKITNDLYTNFKDQLQNILENVKLSQSLETIFHLLTFQQRCIRNFCYENPHFKVLNSTSITATFQKSFQTLKRAIFVTCTVQSRQKDTLVFIPIILV